MNNIQLTNLDKLSQINFNNLHQLIKVLIATNSQLKAVLTKYHLATFPLVISKLDYNQASELNRINLTITINSKILDDWKQLVKTIFNDVWTILVFNDTQADATMYVNSCVKTIMNYQYNPNLVSVEQTLNLAQKSNFNEQLDNTANKDSTNNQLMHDLGTKIYLDTIQDDGHCTGNKPILYHFLNNSYQVKSWNQMFNITCDVLYQKYQLEFIKHLNVNQVSKNKTNFHLPHLISNSDYYVETNYSCKDLLKKIIKMLGWYKIELKTCYFILRSQ